MVASSGGKLTGLVLLLLTLGELTTDTKLLITHNRTEVLGFLTPNHFRFEIERKNAPHLLLFFDAEQTAILLALFHCIASIEGSTKN